MDGSNDSQKIIILHLPRRGCVEYGEAIWTQFGQSAVELWVSTKTQLTKSKAKQRFKTFNNLLELLTVGWWRLMVVTRVIYQSRKGLGVYGFQPGISGICRS